MAHELSFRTDGTAEFIARESAWHGLGQIKGDAITYAEAMDVVGYEVAARPLTTTVPLIDANGDEYDSLEAEVPEQRAIVRVDTRMVLGVVGNRYEVVQNREVMRVGEALVDAGLATIEAAGVLRQGADAWMSMKFIGDAFTEVAEKTPTLTNWFGLLRANHTGRSQVQLGTVGLVVVCANTLAMALGGRGSLIHSVRHTASAKTKVVQEAQRLWGASLTDASNVSRVLNQLLQTVITEAEFAEAVLDVLAAIPVLGEDKSDRAKARHATMVEKAEETRMIVRNLWVKGTGVTGTLTAYDALMAATEAMDHYNVGGATRGDAKAEKGIALLPGGTIDLAKSKITNNLMALAV